MLWTNGTVGRPGQGRGGPLPQPGYPQPFGLPYGTPNGFPHPRRSVREGSHPTPEPGDEPRGPQPGRDGKVATAGCHGTDTTQPCTNPITATRATTRGRTTPARSGSGRRAGTARIPRRRGTAGATPSDAPTDTTPGGREGGCPGRKNCKAGDTASTDSKCRKKTPPRKLISKPLGTRVQGRTEFIQEIRERVADSPTDRRSTLGRGGIGPGGR